MMMPILNLHWGIEQNHEVWWTCPHCGNEYDARWHQKICPDCGRNVDDQAKFSLEDLWFDGDIGMHVKDYISFPEKYRYRITVEGRNEDLDDLSLVLKNLSMYLKKINLNEQNK